MSEALFEIRIKDEGEKQKRILHKYHGNERVVQVPDGVTRIAFRAFAQCPDVEEIYLPASVRSIEEKAFFGCPVLHTIHFLCADAIGFSENVFDGTPTPLEIHYAGTSEAWLAALKPFTTESKSYDNGWGGGAPGLYIYEDTHNPMGHGLSSHFVCHVHCHGDGETLTVKGENTGGRRTISTPYD